MRPFKHFKDKPPITAEMGRANFKAILDILAFCSQSGSGTRGTDGWINRVQLTMGSQPQ